MRVALAIVLALLPLAPAHAQAILVARAVGPNQWKLETGGGTMRNLRLAEGQKIILIDGKGTREIKGPGELMLLSKGVAKGAPTFSMVFRATVARPGPSVKAGVRGGPDAASARAEFEELTTRDAAPNQ